MIHGKKYERKLDNFLSLCQRCHMEYDNTMVAGGWNKGQKWSDEIRMKISVGTKVGMAKMEKNLC